MGRERPALSFWDIPGGHRGLDLSPGPMSGKPDDGIANPGAGAAGLAGRVRIGCRTDRYPSSGGRIPRQRRCAVTPFADCLGPLIPPPLEPMANCATRISSGQHGHDGGDPQFGQIVRMRGVVGRQIDREPGFDGRSDQAPVLDSDSMVAEDGLMGKGDDVLAGIGSDELVEKRIFDMRTISGRKPARVPDPAKCLRLVELWGSMHQWAGTASLCQECQSV
jgi:hypothetical protein